jgi:DedD protein
MAIFSTRSSKKGEDQAPTKNVPIDSIETLRTRARQRLIGAVVLVALGIVAFTLLFDSQPRPIPVDIQITMPDKDKPDSTVTATIPAPAAPVTAAPPAPSAPQVATPAAPSVAAPAAAAAAAAAAAQASASLSPKEEFVAPKAEKKPDAKPEAKPEPKVEAKPVAKPETKPEVKPAKPATNDEAAKAMAILEGKTPPKAAAATSASDADSNGRFVVQVGAFAEKDKAQQVRLKVERAGMKTYTNVAQTKDGARTRVRVGPFSTRAEAEKAAAKIKTLDLPAAILTL